MIDLIGKEPDIRAKAVTVREQLFRYLPKVLNGPHEPALTELERAAVFGRLAYLAINEYRVRFYTSGQLPSLAVLRPGSEKNPTELPYIILVWAGRIEPKDYKEPKAKAVGYAANGRVIRSARGL